MKTLFLISFLLLPIGAFPDRHKEATVIGVQEGACDSFDILITYWDHTGDPYADRMEFYLADKTLFAVLTYDPVSHQLTDLAILGPGKRITHFKNPDDAPTPCASAEALLKERSI